MNLKPEILTHPHIPPALHGVAPREIMGNAWWDKTRKEVYASTDYHCIACGVHKTEAKKHKWLEAHEFWNIDYLTGVCTISEIVPLCHYCHNFIHSGRLSMIIGGEKSEEEVRDILQHGIDICLKNGLKIFPFTWAFAKKLGCNINGILAYQIKANPIKWNEWVLKWNGEQYRSKFKSETDWRNHYK